METDNITEPSTLAQDLPVGGGESNNRIKIELAKLNTRMEYFATKEEIQKLRTEIANLKKDIAENQNSGLWWVIKTLVVGGVGILVFLLGRYLWTVFQQHIPV